MGIENADYIPELVQSSPLGSAAVAEGDNELRQIKKVLQQSWPDLPASAVINAGENPSEPAEGLGAPTNVMLWSPLAIADFVKKYWSGWGLSPPSGQQSFRVTYVGVLGFSIPHNTATKIEWNTTTWDTATWWDGTNFRYTPQEAGIWRFNAATYMDPSSPAAYQDHWELQIRKNGTIVNAFRKLNQDSELHSCGVDAMVSLNGTTDYVEIWVIHDWNSTEQTGVDPRSWFEGHRIGDA